MVRPRHSRGRVVRSIGAGSGILTTRGSIDDLYAIQANNVLYSATFDGYPMIHKLLTNSSILNPLPSTSTLTGYFKDSMCYISWSLPAFSFYSFKGFLKSSYH